MPGVRGSVRLRAGAPKPVAANHAEAQLANLFDYCRSLLGREEDALATARSIMISAQALLDDPDQRRVWCFALARRYASALPSGSTQSSYSMPLPAVSAGLHTVLAAYEALTGGEREILDLVYRHGIRPAHLPAVLGIEPGEAYRCLVTAEEEFLAVATDSGAIAGADLDDFANLPLATLPTLVGGQSLHLGGPEFEAEAARTSERALAHRRLQLSAAAVVPLVGALAWAVVALAGPGDAHGSYPAARSPQSAAIPAGQLAGTPNPASAVRPERSVPAITPISAFLPVPGRSAPVDIDLPPPYLSTSPPPASQPPASTPPASQPPASTPPASQPPTSTPPASQPPASPTPAPPSTAPAI